MIPYIIILVVIPFSPTLFALNLDVGIFFVMAMSSVSVIGVLMAGWSSANKFSLIGALRAAAQLIAYELPLVLAAAAVVMQAGTLSLVGIIESQRSLWNIARPWQLVGFLVFMWRRSPSSPARRSICRSRTPRSSSAPTPSTRA